MRSGQEAIIEYLKGHQRIHFRMGTELNQLTDQEILNRWNDYLAAIALNAAPVNESCVAPSSRPNGSSP